MRRWLGVVLCAFAVGGCGARQEKGGLGVTEGMWLPKGLPVEKLKGMGFEVKPGWAEKVLRASVNVGASGAFVPAEGLILTNHHVALRGLHNVSTKERDYVERGFSARQRREEIRLPGQEARVLVSMEDVMGRVSVDVRAV